MTGPNDDKIRCFGKNVSCPQRSDCELGAPCLNRAREFLDNYHFGKQHICVSQVEYDPNRDDHDDADEIARACFALIGLGIMLILNEVKRNAKVVNCYTECSFFTSPPDFAPQPGPDAPGTPERGADDGTER